MDDNKNDIDLTPANIEAKKKTKTITDDVDNKLLSDIASNLKSTRFILAVLTVIPSMTFFGYMIVVLQEAKDKLTVIGMVNAIMLMVLTFYFSERLQNSKGG